MRRLLEIIAVRQQLRRGDARSQVVNGPAEHGWRPKGDRPGNDDAQQTDDQAGAQRRPDLCQGHLLAILEKQYGTDNPIVVPTLTSQATALRALGRNEEAAKIEQRIKSIQSTAMNQN